MTNLDAMCRQAFDRHQALLAQAARRRLLSDFAKQSVTDAPHRPWRAAVAAWLRRAADRLEPAADRPSVVVLRNPLTR